MEAEVFGPHIPMTKFMIEDLYDVDGNLVEVANKPMQILKMKSKLPMEKDAMIRKVMKKDRSDIY